MKARLGWVLLSLLFLLLALVSQAPAWLAGETLARQTAGKLRLENASGTLFSGQGQLQLGTARGAVVIVERLGWSMEWLPLLRGIAAFEIFSAGETAGKVELSPARIAARQVNLALPAAVLNALPQLETARLEGTLQVSLPDLVWAPQASRGGGEVVWREAAVQAASVGMRWRGDIRALVSAENDTLRIATQGASPVPFSLELKRTPEGFAPRISAGK